MKLNQYLPEAPKLLEHEIRLGELTNSLSVMKGGGDSYKAPSIGLDQVVNSWLRQQMAYRQQMVLDFMSIAATVQEVRAPIHHLTSEVFRRGVNWKPKFAVKCNQCGTEFQDGLKACQNCQSTDLRTPDEKQKEKLESFLNDCNIYDQSLEEVLRQFYTDINILDDGFIYIAKEYVEGPDKSVRSRPIEVRRLHPALIEFDLDRKGLPKNSHFVCYIHREGTPQPTIGVCPECDRPLLPAMYKYWDGGKIQYFLDSEILHSSKFNPSETYGISPIFTLFEKILSIIGMDKCYAEGTEVLTRAGWKDFKDVGYTDEFLTLSESGVLEYQNPVHVEHYYHDGPMYEVKNRFLDLLVTPHHRMYAKRRGADKYAPVEAQEIFGQPYQMWRGSGKWLGERKDTFVLPGAKKRSGMAPKTIKISPDAWARFLGAWYVLGKTYRYRLGLQGVKYRSVLESLVADIPIKWHYENGRLEASSRSLSKYLVSYNSAKDKLLSDIVNRFDARLKSIFYSTVKDLGGVLSSEFNPLSGVEDEKNSTDLVEIGAPAVEEVLPAIEIDMDIWLEFLGYYIAEGSLHPVKYGVVISQKKQESFDVMWECVQKLPFTWHKIYDRGCLVGMFCSDARLWNYLKPLGTSRVKYVPEEFMSLSAEQLRIFYDAWVLGDAGTTTSNKLRDQMMEIALKCGWGVFYRSVPYKTGKGVSGAINYVTTLRNPKHWDVNINGRATKGRDSWADYRGMTYCVEVPNHTLFIRRNGKVVVGLNTLYRYFYERRMPSSMIMVFTDDPESLRRERENIAAKMRLDPAYTPMIAVSSKNNRGRVDMVRLFHTLQEMDYLPVRQEIRERIAAMWGVTPVWQGAVDAVGGLNASSQQLTVMSRVIEGDQRLFHDKVFPRITEAFGMTDWELELPQPEEKAEATRISFAQQKISAASTLFSMGFDVKVKSTEVGITDIDFVVSGQAKRPDMGGGMFGGLGADGGGGFGGQLPAGGGQEEGGGGEGQQPPQLQLMQKAQGWIEQILSRGYTINSVLATNPDGPIIKFAAPGGPYLAKFMNGNLVSVDKEQSNLHAHGIYPPHDINQPHSNNRAEPRENPYRDVDNEVED